MRWLLLLAVLTVGCGDDITHPTYIPTPPIPPGVSDGLCGTPDATGSRYVLEPCA